MIQRCLLRTSQTLGARAQSLRLASSISRPFPISTRFSAPQRAQIASRWYSDTKADKATEAAAEEIKEDSQAKEEPKEEDPVKKELEDKKKEIIKIKDQYLRSVADFRNLQERSKRDQDAARNFAIQKFARDLIESIDNFDLALSNVPKEKLEGDAEENKDLRQLHSGLKMVESVLMNTMKKHGLERFDPSEKGEKFDPNVHEATFQTPQPDKEDGTCFYTTQKGFILNGRVVRAAKVGVVKNS